MRQLFAALPPTALVSFTALLWGTLWIPSRWLDGHTAGAGWGWLVVYTMPALLLAPLLPGRGRFLAGAGARLWLAALLFALSFTLYPEALVRGQVARVVLLFHASVVWSTLFARFFLAEPITARRMLALALGLAGLVALFGFEAGIPLPRSAADWMALGSGIAWSMSLVLLRLEPTVDDMDKVAAIAVLLPASFALVALLPGGSDLAVPPAAALVAAVVLLALLLAALWVLPILWATVDAATRLEPGRVSLILMLEIVVGIGGAAVLADEVPGPREIAGAVLIMCAVGTELLARRRRPA